MPRIKAPPMRPMRTLGSVFVRPLAAVGRFLHTLGEMPRYSSYCSPAVEAEMHGCPLEVIQTGFKST